MTSLSFDLLALEEAGDTPVTSAVKFHPTFKKNYNLSKPKRIPVDQLESVREQEALVIQDMLHVLAGLEGSYIRYSESFDSDNRLHKLRGPDYLINKHIDSGLKDVVKRLTFFGKVYLALKSFSEIHDNIVQGQVIQSLCTEIRSCLKKYEFFLVELEQEFQNNSDFSLTSLEQSLNMNVALPFNHLYEIISQINKENERRMDKYSMVNMRFQSMMRSLKEDYYTGTLDGVTSDARTSPFVKGGLALQIVQNRSTRYKGDPQSQEFLFELFNNMSRSYVSMLNSWLESGVIDDPAEEFLINESITTNPKFQKSADFWADKFSIRNEGQLKQFESPEVQKKIILTGKYLSVLDECGIDIRAFEPLSNPIDSLESRDFFIKIDEAYMRSNTLILKLLFDGYHLREFLEGLNKYFLLTDNHQFDDFLDLVVLDLRKSPNNLSLSKLAKQYHIGFFRDSKSTGDSPQGKSNRLINYLISVKLSEESLVKELSIILNAHTTDSDEIFSSTNINSLKQLLNATLETNRATNNETSTGTKVEEYSLNKFYLDLEIPFPLNLIITRSQIFEYQLMFRNLLYLKYVEKSLDMSWKEIGYQRFWTFNFSNGLRKWIKKCRMLHFKMRNFIRIFSVYTNFFVINENWKKVESMFDRLDRGDEEVELEMLFIGIKSFLSTILTNCLLTKVKLIEITHQMLVIILLYHNFLMSLRKSLILLDERLFDQNNHKLPAGSTFDSEKNLVRVARLSDALQKYEKSFDIKLHDFLDAIRYYGEVDTPSLLILHEELVSAFNVKDSF